MAVLQQIRTDAEFLRMLISSLRSDRTTVTCNGKTLTGADLEQNLNVARLQNQAELKKLELILESGIIPKKYHSLITKQDYYPSTEEQYIKVKLPSAKYSFFATKTSRKNTEQKLSGLTILSDNLIPRTNFFLEHKQDKKYPHGGYAKIKQGFLEEGKENQPKYAIKIYHQDMFSGDDVHELRLAMRAAYCYQQFGREGYSFRRNKKQYLVTEWLPGVNLYNADEKAIQSMSISRRIVMAISLMRELNILHKQGLIHNDIKPSNVIVNYGQLRFVDLDSVRPKNEVPLHGIKPVYTDRYLPDAQMSFDAIYDPTNLFLKFNEKTDLYALGITLAYLFPEIYTPKEQDLDVKVQNGNLGTFKFKTVLLHHGPKYSEHTQLQQLLKQMLFPNDASPSSTEAFIKVFKEVLTTYPDYEKYLEEVRLQNLGQNLSPADGEKAFKDIEIELLTFNERLNSLRPVAS